MTPETSPPLTFEPIEHGPFASEDAIGRVKNWPPATKAVFGLPPEAEVTRDTFARLLHPDDAARFEAAYAAAMRGDGPRSFELSYRIRRANDGAERWIRFNAAVVREGDQPGRLVGAVRDITEDLAEQARLRQSARQLAMFTEFAPAAIAMFDRDMNYLAASRRWRRDFRLAETPVGRSHYEIFPEIPESWKAVHRRSLAGAVESSDGEAFTRADGRVQWVKWEARPWRDDSGGIGGIVISAEEITARKNAEAAAAQLASIVENANDPIIGKDLKLNITSWNAAAERLFGYSAAEMIGQQITRIIPLEKLEEEADFIARLKAGERIDHRDSLRRAKDGRVIDVSLTISPIRDAIGEVVGASTIIRDISEQKRAEGALRESEENLRILADSLPDSAVYRYTRDPQGAPRFLYLSAGIEKLNGVRIDEALADADVLHRQIPAEFMAKLAEAEQVSARDLSDFDMDVPMRRPDGEMRWMRLRSRPRRTSDGRIVWHGVQTDVTERKHAMAALRDSEERKTFLLVLADALKPLSEPDDIKKVASEALGRRIGGNQVLYAEIDASGEIATIAADWNDGAMKSNAGVHMTADFGPDFIADLRAGRTVAIDDVAVDPRTSSTESLATFQARSIAAFISVPLIKNGSLVCVLSVHCRNARHWNETDVMLTEDVAERTWSSVVRANDIAERVRAEKALRQSRTLLMATIEQMPVAIAVTDAEGKFVLKNSRASRFASEQVASQDDANYGRWWIWDAAGVRVRRENYPSARALRGEDNAAAEALYRAPDGSETWTHVAATPLRGETGAVTGCIIIVTDIDQAKQTEQALRASHQRFQLAAEATGVGVWEWNTLTDMIIWDAEMFRIYGIPPTPGGVVDYDTWANAVLPEDLPESAAQLRKHAREGGVNRREFRLRRRNDGEIRVIQAVETTRVNADGANEWIVGTNLDITERKRAEDALRISEIRLSHAADASGLTYAEFDLRERKTHVAKNFAKVMGYRPVTPETGGGIEAGVASFLAHVAPEDRPRVEEALARFGKTGETNRMEYRLVGDDGVERWIDSIARADLDAAGRPVRAFIANLDISGAKAAEAALRESEQKFRQLADAMDQLAWVAHADGAIYWYNRRWYEYTGTAPEEMLGWGWRRVHDPEALPDVMARWTASLETGQPFDMTFPLRGADGVFRPFLTRVMPARNAEGRIVQWFGTNTEINAQKELEAALRQAKQDAERANRSKSKFLAAASHDLRQPVQSLVLLLSLIERQVASLPKAVETTKMMKQALGGLNGLLTSILDISRLDAGVVEASIEKVDLGALLMRLYAEYAAKAESRGLELRLVPHDLHALADPTLAERALRNLIENALRYTPSGGVLIGLRRRGQNVRIDVVDTGVGVPDEKRTEIFDEFTQLNNPGRDLGQGLGLGLAIVARLVALMHGQIEVRSRPGRGSRFSLTLPAVSPDEPNDDARPEHQDDPRGRILIVEDNASLRHGLEKIAQAWGCRTLAAASGEEALALGSRHDWRFDAVVSDYRLGAGLNGVDAAREIARRSGQAFPTLILTGDTGKERIAEIAASGFELLHKPVDADELRRKLARLLSLEDKISAP